MPGQRGRVCVFQMWNNSKSPIKYLWGKISESHIIEVEPCSGLIGSSPVDGCGRPGAGLRGPRQDPGCPVARSGLGLDGNCARP